MTKQPTPPTSTDPPTRRHTLRWCWMGLSLAAILWLSSGIYRQQMQPLDEIEYQSDMLSQQEIDQKNHKKDQTQRLCQYAAIAIAVGSLVYLGKQLSKS